jgi:hypothetical protein
MASNSPVMVTLPRAVLLAFLVLLAAALGFTLVANAPTPTATSTPTPTPTVTPTPTPTPGFPTAATTGVPAGTTLTPYTGPLSIQMAGVVIDSMTVTGDLRIFAKGVVIRNSVINGTVYTDSDANVGGFTITDSTVNVGNQQGTGIGDVNYTALRVQVSGGNRSINCFRDCTVLDSYVHGQFRDASGKFHESGIRMGSNSTIIHNYVLCDAPNVAPDAGCSADLTGYGDFAIVQNNLIQGNFFADVASGYCAYGGSTGGKSYSAGVNHIVFRNNTWQKNAQGTCGSYGPVTSFDSAAPGNIWTGNVWTDGTVVQPAN